MPNKLRDFNYAFPPTASDIPIVGYWADGSWRKLAKSRGGSLKQATGRRKALTLKILTSAPGSPENTWHHALQSDPAMSAALSATGELLGTEHTSCATWTALTL